MINISSDTQILIQGITQPSALATVVEMHRYGMKVVAGVNAGLGKQMIHG
jgi:succinyl-CoA synthetase alpha subunit